MAITTMKMNENETILHDCGCAPPVRQHKHIAAHLDKKYSSQGYPVTMITAIAMEHYDGRSCCRKLSSIGR